jgi:hypothetical protein
MTEIAQFSAPNTPWVTADGRLTFAANVFLRDLWLRAGGSSAPTNNDLALSEYADAGIEELKAAFFSSVNEYGQIPGGGLEELRAALYAVSDDLGQMPRTRTDLAQLYGGNVFAGSQVVTPVVLTDAATITPDAAQSNHFTVTLGGNRTMANPLNLQNGVILNFKIKQDGTGSRTLTWGSKFKWSGGTAPTLTTTASGRDLVTAMYFADEDILVGNAMLAVA